jgi:hypothetical protein
MLSPIDCPFLLFSESMKCDVLFGPASIACVAGYSQYGRAEIILACEVAASTANQ